MSSLPAALELSGARVLGNIETHGRFRGPWASQGKLADLHELGRPATARRACRGTTPRVAVSVAQTRPGAPIHHHTILHANRVPQTQNAQDMKITVEPSHGKCNGSGAARCGRARLRCSARCRRPAGRRSGRPGRRGTRRSWPSRSGSGSTASRPAAAAVSCQPGWTLRAMRGGAFGWPGPF